jgi:hypothetical protein
MSVDIFHGFAFKDGISAHPVIFTVIVGIDVLVKQVEDYGQAISFGIFIS